MRLSVIIINYNTKELTNNCMQSLFNIYAENFEKGEFEIIVVDNNSSDGSVETLTELSSKKEKAFSVIRSTSNLGFAKGCNAGAKRAKGEYLLFLNSDTTVLNHGFIDMMNFMKVHRSVGIMGPKIMLGRDDFEASAGKFYSSFTTILLLMGLERIGFLRSSPRKTQEVDWVTGAAMMVKKEIFLHLKGFDEHFFMYVEDMELCFRAKMMGIKTFFYVDCLVFHRRHASANRNFAIVEIYKGLLYFYKKHKGMMQYHLLRFLLASKALVTICIGTLSGNTRLVTTYKEALRVSL